jgi:hypothetical protein
MGAVHASIALAIPLLAGCDAITGGGPALPDGDYRVTLTSPIIEQPLLTPGWMGNEMSVDFTRVGLDLSSTASAGGIVTVGSAQRFESQGDGWTAEFSLARLDDGQHYWRFEITSDERCTMGVAVDADLGVGPTGALTVPFRRCDISRR